MNSSGDRPVADVALQNSASVPVVEKVDRARVLNKLRLGDNIFRHVTRLAAITVLIILSGIIFSLVYGSIPALQKFGLHFLIDESWNPVTEQFGAIAPI